MDLIESMTDVNDEVTLTVCLSNYGVSAKVGVKSDFLGKTLASVLYTGTHLFLSKNM